MTLIMMIDQMGQRYGRFPTECLTNATTFDLVIMDAAMSYINFVNQEADGEKSVPNLSVDELMAIKEGRA